MPERIQLRRTKGWRMPPGAVKVDRSTPWGNPFRAKLKEHESGYERDEAISLFERALTDDFKVAIKTVLAGKDLACWCAIGTPCHADVLLRIANSQAKPEVKS